MPVINRHKPLSIYSNPSITKYEFGIQDSPLLALKVAGACVLIVSTVIGGVCVVAVIQGNKDIPSQMAKQAKLNPKQGHSYTYVPGHPSVIEEEEWDYDDKPAPRVIECRDGEC